MGFILNLFDIKLLMLPMNTFVFVFSLNDDAHQQKQMLTFYLCLNYGCDRRRGNGGIFTKLLIGAECDSLFRIREMN